MVDHRAVLESLNEITIVDKITTLGDATPFPSGWRWKYVNIVWQRKSKNRVYLKCEYIQIFFADIDVMNLVEFILV